MQCIAFDSHKHYTWALVETEKGKLVREQRIDHAKGALQGFLEEFEPGSPVAVETIGNWYWITDEIEAAGMVPQLVNARRAKLMSGSINKTDRLDAKCINRLQRSGTLPTVWIPPRDLRDATCNWSIQISPRMGPPMRGENSTARRIMSSIARFNTEAIATIPSS